MRTLPATIGAELTRSGAFPGYLLDLTTAAGVTVRLCTFDADFDCNGFTYVSSDMAVTDIGFDGSAGRGAALEFGDMDIAVWVAALYRDFDDAQAVLSLAYFDALGVAKRLGAYRCGKVQRRSDRKKGDIATIALDAEAAVRYSPRLRIQDFVDPTLLAPAGSIFIIGGQRWIVDRPASADD